MITGEIKNKIDKIWLDIYAGGITQPLTVIEQLTYLMFIRSLDEKEMENESLELLGEEGITKIFPQTDEGQSMRWSKFKDKDSREIYDIVSSKVFPYIKAMNNNEESAFSRYMEDAMFLIPTPQVLQKIITGLDELYEHDIQNLDMQGDLYEYMLGKLATAGQNGQFRTPKHIRDLMVRLLEPTPDDKICDPACGTAGFLISSAEFIREKYETKMTTEQWEKFNGELFSGFDTDRTMLRLSAMNLMLHSISNPNINYADSVSKSNNIEDEYSIILANPPFTGTVDEEGIHDNLKSACNTKKTELLFLALFIRMLKVGGRCACIVPDGVMFGATKAHKALRKEIVDNQQLQAIISMPSGVFKPYAGVSTAILVFTKTNAGGTDKVWFYDMKSDGFSLDDKRNNLGDGGDISDIIERFHNLEKELDRKKIDQSFLVNKAEIEENDYDLSINRYKEIEYEKVEYDAPEEIMTRLDELALDISSKMEELRELMDNE
ncbi:DNA methyltransferase [Clostridium sp. 2-1]|uniref:type I restriction-modification system subunit M n=1 Tax=Clostridium TaxID=1485 RepID=UPI000CDA59AC|nr:MULTISPECIES: class I SAM-dependent DNA methyltransferase [Clostridium]MBN7576852.1 SAM-dependent DNA methyltransferase [Clostridium beijerinckii]MBN7581339.1 SAM-dependent DNA methyltransferase [Clostridium beijerinckii]MBN7586632.1 SAM-dependent DNA methyltransferase [Clostridium beijerinckii]MBO0522783.1 SAM-dependent DNA methyltransferase [Clostridium beijerinckii]POO89558.1 DNA methyltransferase [Clostridium sp. 2-1]